MAGKTYPNYTKSNECDQCGHSPEHSFLLEIDHKLPLSVGGTNDVSNLWTLCVECHRKKTLTTDKDLIREYKEKHGITRRPRRKRNLKNKWGYQEEREVSQSNVDAHTYIHRRKGTLKDTKKVPTRLFNIRMESEKIEAFGQYAKKIGTDRSKILNAYIDALLSPPPEAVPPAEDAAKPIFRMSKMQKTPILRSKHRKLL